MDIKNIERERAVKVATNGNIASILNNELPDSFYAMVDNTKTDSNIIEIIVPTTTNLPFRSIVTELMALVPLILHNSIRKISAQITTFVIKKDTEVSSFVWMT